MRILRDLDEFKIRYVKNRINDKLYREEEHAIYIDCYNDDIFSHKFIVTSVAFNSANNIIMNRKLKNSNIYEIIMSSEKDISKNKLNLFYWRLNKLLTQLALTKEDINYKDYKYLTWLYNIKRNELEQINKTYFYDKSIIPYDKIDIKEFDLEYNNIPYVYDYDSKFITDTIKDNNNLESTIKEINKRQIKSKIKAKDIYTK